MTTKIYKYEISPKCDLQLPRGALVLSVGCQGDSLFLWAEVQPEAREKESRHFVVYGTGHEIPETAGVVRKFIGTAQMHGGSLVWHVFEEYRQG
jgi:hypothetical protein